MYIFPGAIDTSTAGSSAATKLYDVPMGMSGGFGPQGDEFEYSFGRSATYYTNTLDKMTGPTIMGSVVGAR